MHNGIRTALIVGLILAVVGAGLVGAGVALGGQTSFRVDTEHHTIQGGGEDLVRGEIAAEPFTSLQIEVATADVSVAYGEGYAIRYALPNEPEFKQEDGSAVFTAQQEHHTIGFVGFNFSNENVPHVTVTVPADAALADITLVTATGDVLLTDIAAEELHVSCATGDVALDAVRAGSVQIENNTGDVTLEALRADTLHVENNTGDVRAQDCTITGEINASTSTGDVALALRGELSDYALSLKTGTGDVVCNGKDRGHAYETEGGVPLRAEAATGDVTVRVG